MKKIFYVLLTLVLLMIAGIMLLPYFISVETVKQQVLTSIESATGRKLTIEGDFKLTFFPNVSVVAKTITVSNPPNFPDKTPFATLDTLKVDLALLPLLQRDIVINSFVLDKPVVRLHQTKNGQNNWDFSTETAKEAKSSTPAASGPSAAFSLPANLRLSDVSIKDGSFTLVDDVKKSTLEIQKLNTQLTLEGIEKPFSLKGDAEWNKQTVKIDAKVSTLQSLLHDKRTDIDVTLAGHAISVKLTGNVEANTFNGKANLSSSSLKKLMAWLNPEAKPMPTPAPLSLEMTSDLRCGLVYCDLTKLQLALDNIKAAGQVKAAMADNKPNVTLDLTVDELDLNPFIGTSKEASSDGFFISSAFAQPAQWSSAPIDFSALRSLNLNAIIKTGSIRYQTISIGKSTLSAKIQQGKLTANVSEAQLYGGSGTIAIVVDASAPSAAIDVRTSLKDVELEPVLKDVMDLQYLSGKANMNLHLSGSGNNQQQIVSTLDGNGQFKFNDGVIKGIDLLNMLRNAQSAFAAVSSKAQDTPFTSMEGSFVMNNGVLNNQDLLLVVEGFNISGQGSINLPAYTINYRLTPKTMGLSKSGQKAEGLSVPVLITGSLNQPSFQPDVASLVKDALTDPTKLREQLKNSQRAIKDQIKQPKEAIKELKNLFKGF